MNEVIRNYLEQLDEQTRSRFLLLYALVRQSTPLPVEEKMWAGLPSFYVGDRYVRIIPFKGHINLEAKAILPNRESLSDFKLTPKGMLQIPHTQSIPEALIVKIVGESLV